jgi:hypothetical protein
MVRKRFDRRLGTKPSQYTSSWEIQGIEPTDLHKLKLPKLPVTPPTVPPLDAPSGLTGSSSLQPSGSQSSLSSSLISPQSSTSSPPSPDVKPTKKAIAPQLAEAAPVNPGSLDAKPQPRRSRRQQMRSARSWSWSLLGLGAILLCGGLGAGALRLLTTLPPLPDCGKMSPIAADSERLYCAQEGVRSGELPQLVAGLQLVEQWSPEHPLYRDAQKLMADWSEAILAIATDKINHNDLPGAVETASHIPPISPIYAEAQAAIDHWQEQWKQGEALYKTAQEALQNQYWDKAAEQVPALAQLENPYWRQRADQLTSQILIEKQARAQLVEARNLAKRQNSKDLGEAIALAQQIVPSSHAWTEAKTELTQWSQELLKAGMQQWQQGNLEAAIALVQQVPPDPTLAPDAPELVQYSHAQRMASWSAVQWQPSFKQIWGLMQALSTVSQIEPDSQLYRQAQAERETWQSQLDDLIQLQFANLSASLGQRFALEAAIQQAELVGSDRPRRVQAQTLVAHWRQEIERVEDRPYLLRARELAEPGTIPALRVAIAQASVIPLNRALRGEAQAAIASWNRRIETIEDQPFLDEAKTLASQGKRQEAIVAAEKIRSGRALYAEAQTAIRNWRTEIQIAEDRPILNEAYSLAEQGSLSSAIDVASQIGRGRALYSEARSAIAQWRIEREIVWDSWAAEPAPESDDSYYEDYEESY